MGITKKTMLAVILTICGNSLITTSCTTAENDNPVVQEIDYLVLVNKTHKLPAYWEGALQTVTITNTVGDKVEAEYKAYAAYLKLKEALAKEGVDIELDSGRRSVAEQQDIWDRYIIKYGEEYTVKTVAVPGYSEHHTGLALDLYFILDGQTMYYNEDLVKYPEVWAKIHAKLADYGFILRYLEGKEDITGYAYEPWHIRYIDDVALAKDITARGITLEEYLQR
ncbi:MAG: M15 family metallopeptidase [Bacteroidaceae bacterium]|nr:M15 family metallopeptidase [Bacteroidaceae bacterium]